MKFLSFQKYFLQAHNIYHHRKDEASNLRQNSIKYTLNLIKVVSIADNVKHDASSFLQKII